jgi:hypothetical protein
MIQIILFVLWISGAEDKYAYIWDRHYGGVLAKLNHLGNYEQWRFFEFSH